MSLLSRILIALASLALLATFVLPFWEIYLIAPQYPEGLAMQIWLDKITGEVDIINGLNHYIGMRHIKAEMFPEFRFLVYIMGGFIVLGLLVTLMGNRKLLAALLVLMLLGAGAALYDFYQWGYDYGHNLDPKAAIQVPGLSYQPPLLGHKKLLNFDAYSYPAYGGWIVITAALLLFLVWLWEGRPRKKTAATGNFSLPAKQAVLAAVLATSLLVSCTAKPEPIVYGKDACHFCKMTIVAKQFGGEVLTKKGRVYKFDDLHCLAGFLKSGSVKPTDIAQTLAIDYNNPGSLIDATTASFVSSAQLHSPMNGNAAAVTSASQATPLASKLNGQLLNWQNLYNQLK